MKETAAACMSGAPVAAIEIGSTGIRLLIASIEKSGAFKVLDRAGKPSRIGRDAFTLGHIGREAMRESVAILSSFHELLAGYGIDPREVRTIGTSALREASNRDTFVDRIALQTGFKVRIVEEIEETHLMYLAVQQALQDERHLLTKTNAMILEVGGGTTEIMLLRRGSMAASHSLHIGTLRLDEQMRGSGASKEHIRQYLESNVRAVCELLDSDLPLESIKTFIVIGADARFAAYCVSGHNFEAYSVLEREKFVAFIDSFTQLSPEESVATWRINWDDAESFASGLIIESLFLERTGAEIIVVPNVSIREGLLLAEARGPDSVVKHELRRQVLASAASLGRKFRYDEAHARNVSAVSVSIFDALHREHGLGHHERLLLETAALLHDIGSFIRPSGHHRHGEYIIANSEIFGLNRNDLTILSNVVRYHRHKPPSSLHVNFISLPREDRMLVMKLAAILRVADALDRSHAGRIRELSFERGENRFAMRPSEALDWSLERLSLADKGDMFEEVFGLVPILQ